MSGDLFSAERWEASSKAWQEKHEHALETIDVLTRALETVPIHRLGEMPEAFIERFKSWYRETRNPAINKAKES